MKKLPEQLKQVIRQEIQREKAIMEKSRLRDDILSRIVKECDVAVPEILITAEKRRFIEDLKRKCQEVFKITFEDYLKKLKKTEEELETMIKEEVAERLKRILILREIQKAEGIKASEDELQKELEAFLKHPANQKIKGNIDQNALKSYLKERIEQEKTLRFLEQLSNSS